MLAFSDLAFIMAAEDIQEKQEVQEQMNGEVENKEEVKEDEVIESKSSAELQLVTDSLVPAVTIRLPAPQNSKTLPKPPADVSFSTFVVYPQPNETLQDLRAALNEWAGGYWLGPYSFRIPAPSSTDGERGQVLGTGKENVEIREGEKLSDWLEVGDVFGHIEGKGERVLDVVRGKCSHSLILLLSIRTLLRVRCPSTNHSPERVHPPDRNNCRPCVQHRTQRRHVLV